MQETILYERNIKKFYMGAIFIGFGFFYMVIQSLYLREFSLSFTQIGFLISSTLITTLILQIPTGHFADKYGKKKSILIATVIKCLAIVSIIIANDFYGFLIGFVLFGVGSAFSSGAGSSLLYQTLSQLGKKETYLKHRGRMESLYLLGEIGASAAPFLFSLHAKIPYLVALASLCIAFFIQLTLYEKVEATTVEKPTLKEKLTLVVKNRGVMFFISISGIFFVVITFFSSVAQSPLFVEAKHFSLSEFGFISLISSIVLVISVSFINNIEKKFGIQRSLLLMVLVIPLTLILMTAVNSLYIAALILAVYSITTSFAEIVIEHYIHARIDDSNRATILSLNSMFSSLLALLLIPIFGAVVDVATLSSGIIFSAIALLVIASVLIVLNKGLLKS